MLQSAPRHLRIAIAAALSPHVLPIALGSGGSGRTHALPATSMLHFAPANRCAIRLMKARLHPRRRRPKHASRCPSVPCAQCRELWPLTAPATPRRRALSTAHCPRCTLPTAPVTPARATAAIGKVAAAAAAAAETCCMRTAQPAWDCQGARDMARARATEDARPTVES